MQALLLEHGDWLPAVADRLNLIYLLHHLYLRQPPTDNPFLAVFDRILKVSPPLRPGPRRQAASGSVSPSHWTGTPILLATVPPPWPSIELLSSPTPQVAQTVTD